MEAKSQLGVIRSEIERHVGKKVNLKDSAGRKKVLIEDGVIENAYSSIFTVKVEGSFDRIIAYSYSDVLTKTVQIQYIA
ncbi:Veg family protein [Hathewaya histolytica]|uniref:Veg protein n=1 Tax=Hathewaya histolytica TaxID=1498 RepID=A0A4U9RRM2_HATHI|nr:Veg family protein [Hathewaya histolytica]VTQ94261.1 veg protein [Hathewaya histolytica]